MPLVLLLLAACAEPEPPMVQELRFWDALTCGDSLVVDTLVYPLGQPEARRYLGSSSACGPGRPWSRSMEHAYAFERVLLALNDSLADSLDVPDPRFQPRSDARIAMWRLHDTDFDSAFAAMPYLPNSFPDGRYLGAPGIGLIEFNIHHGPWATLLRIERSGAASDTLDLIGRRLDGDPIERRPVYTGAERDSLMEGVESPPLPPSPPVPPPPPVDPDDPRVRP